MIIGFELQLVIVMAAAPKDWAETWAETWASHTMQRDGAMRWIVGFWCIGIDFTHPQHECWGSLGLRGL